MARERPTKRKQGGAGASRRPEWAAAGLSAIWIAATLGALVLFGGAGLTSFAIVMLSTAVILPLAMIWLYVFALRLTTAIAENHAQMRQAIEALRQDLAALGAGGSSAAPRSGSDNLGRRLAEITEAQRRAEAMLARLAGASPRPRNPAPAEVPETRQPERRASPHPAAAPAGPSSDAAAQGAPELDTAELISALQFPADADDADGFRALRRAMQAPGASQLVTAAQDVLTLLSQDGVYVDDFALEPRPAEAWRRFVAGERDPAMEGAIGDAATREAVKERIERDTIFRDAVHHFLRLFERRLPDLAETFDDAELAALMETRTGRAFLLLDPASER